MNRQRSDDRLDRDVGGQFRQVARARFLTLEQVEFELGVSHAQAYALVRTGALRAVKIGGRGLWRIARTDLEAFIAAAYSETREWVTDHPPAPRRRDPAVTPAVIPATAGRQVAKKADPTPSSRHVDTTRKIEP